MKLVASAEMDYRNSSIVGLAAALGMGVSQATAALASFPTWVTTIFGKSPVVLATIIAVLLNVILPRTRDEQKEEAKKKIESNEGFNYLGVQYDIIYVDYCDISFGTKKVFLNKKLDIDKWYKKQAKVIFKEHLDNIYNRYSEKIPYPDLRIRKMTTRWGVCNIKTKTVTLNLELIKRDLKYLDYVIVHELSHLIEANHSKAFWALVEENCKDYKKYRKEMKDF